MEERRRLHPQNHHQVNFLLYLSRFTYGVFRHTVVPRAVIKLKYIYVSGGGAFKKINDEDEMDSKVAGFALRGNALGLPQPANASWNLKF